jgi:serine/threonine protein phosphatase PrpC
VDTLIVEANRRGGLDNITAVVVRIDWVVAEGVAPVAQGAATTRS